MKLILLPGLDGSGFLFKPLLSYLGKEIETQVININACRHQTRDALVEFVQAALPANEDFVLLAESFSGPIAYDLGLKANSHLKGLIFVASFLTNPKPYLLRLRQFAPIKLYYHFQWPGKIVRHLVLRGGLSKELHALYWKAVNQAGAQRIRQRLDCLAELEEPTKVLSLPSICLHADNDALVEQRCQEDFIHWCNDLNSYSLPGSHFLLQVAPEKCAEVITDELSRLLGGSH